MFYSVTLTATEAINAEVPPSGTPAVAPTSIGVRVKRTATAPKSVNVLFTLAIFCQLCKALDCLYRAVAALKLFSSHETIQSLVSQMHVLTLFNVGLGLSIQLFLLSWLLSSIFFLQYHMFPMFPLQVLKIYQKMKQFQQLLMNIKLTFT